MTKRRRKMLLLICLTPLVLLVVSPLEEHVRGKIGLARYRRQLIAQGEKLSAADFRSHTASGDNGAPEVYAAYAQLQKGKVVPDSYPPAMAVVPSGRAVSGSGEDYWIVDKTTNDWEQLAEDLTANEATLELIRAALAKPVLDNHLDLSLGNNMPITHLAPAKNLARWLGVGAQARLHEGKTHEAIGYLISSIQTTRLIGQDRIIISELVRFAIAAMCQTYSWEALQSGEMTEPDLARLQAAWEATEFVSAMARALEGERIYEEAAFTDLRRSNQAGFNALYGFAAFLGGDDSTQPAWERSLRSVPAGDQAVDFLKRQVFTRFWRFSWLDQDNQKYLAGMQRMITVTRATVREKSRRSLQPPIANFEKELSNEGIYDRLRYAASNPNLSTLSHSVFRSLRAETERSLVICAIALKRYHLRYKKYPDSLAALAPEFLASVPVDYMDGQPIKYRLDADGSFTLYSVGEDGKDDGGDATMMPGKTSGRNRWDRKDFVWPAPATPEEIEIYRREAAKKSR